MSFPFFKTPPQGATVKTFSLPSSSLLSGIQWVFSKTTPNTITPSVDANVYFSQNVYVHGTLNPVSDANVKSNIIPLTEEHFSPLLRLFPKQYTLKKDVDTEKEGELHFGFLAQEVEEVYPQLVEEVHLPINDAEQKMKTLNTLEMIPLLVAKVQQLHWDMELLKQRL